MVRSSKDSVMPRVCFITYSSAMPNLLLAKQGAATGGAEWQLLQISRSLVNLGFHVEFIVCRSGETKQFITPEGIKVTPGILPVSGPRFLRGIPPFIGALRSLFSVRPDVCHVWGAGRPIATVGIYSLLTGTPYIFGVMSNKNVDGSDERSMGIIDRFLFRYMLKRAYKITAETTEELRLLEENYGLKGTLARNICVLPAEAGDEKGRHIIVWVGRMHSIKRPEWFVDLAARIPERQFFMIGGRDIVETERWDTIAKLKESIPNLTLTGQLPFSAVGSYLKRAKLLVLTSAKEGFPNVVLEAWSHGIPVVSTFDPDCVLTGHQLGVFCKDLDELDAAVRDLLNDDLKCAEIGKRAVLYVRENHDPKKIAQLYADIFSSAAARR